MTNGNLEVFQSTEGLSPMAAALPQFTDPAKHQNDTTLSFRMIGVYTITCIATGRTYIGSSTDIMNRLYGHKSRLRGGTHPNAVLQREFSQNGEDSFVFEIARRCGSIKEA